VICSSRWRRKNRSHSPSLHHTRARRASWPGREAYIRVLAGCHTIVPSNRAAAHPHAAPVGPPAWAASPGCAQKRSAPAPRNGSGSNRAGKPRASRQLPQRQRTAMCAPAAAALLPTATLRVAGGSPAMNTRQRAYTTAACCTLPYPTTPQPQPTCASVMALTCSSSKHTHWPEGVRTRAT
jgi:hypothetical protein